MDELEGHLWCRLKKTGCDAAMIMQVRPMHAFHGGWVLFVCCKEHHAANVHYNDDQQPCNVNGN